MKLKNMWKRFWTLDVHNHEGFTLVELIIVIAILAILSTGAIAGYSAYITSANKTADEALAAEIKNALVLAMYSSELTSGDYVVIKHDASAEYGNSTSNTRNDVNSTIYKAMAAAYGEGWENALKLKYADWEMGVVADSTMMGYVNNSCFNGESIGDLLTSVQGITDQFNGVLESGRITIAADSDLAKYLTSLGVDYANDTQSASNATVMYVGNVFANAEVSDEDFYLSWMNLDFGGIISDPYAAASAQYAAILALAQYVDSEKGSTYTASLNSATGMDVIPNATSVAGSIVGTYPETASEYFGVTADGYSTSSRGYADAMAFKAYMKGINTSTDTLVGSTDLGSSNYYTDGTVLGYVTNYISAGEVLSEINADHAFVFLFNGQDVVCVPLDY